jgi:hypothetical protein
MQTKSMNGHKATILPIYRFAARSHVPVDQLWEFQNSGWIWLVEHEGRTCIPERQECKVHSIVYLQKVLGLNPQQTSNVLELERSPYSLSDYDRPPDRRVKSQHVNRKSRGWPFGSRLTLVP